MDIDGEKFKEAVADVRAILGENYSNPDFRAGVHIGASMTCLNFMAFAKDQSNEIKAFVREAIKVVSTDAIKDLERDTK